MKLTKSKIKLSKRNDLEMVSVGHGTNHLQQREFTISGWVGNGNIRLTFNEAEAIRIINMWKEKLTL